MDFSSLTAISPIDGRYADKLTEFRRYFSEFALIKYRVLVEVEYFISLCQLPLPQLATLDESQFAAIRAIHTNFGLNDAQRVKDIERTTNHDVKAVEYYIKEQFDGLGLEAYREYVHFGLTSQDVNNTATPLMLKDALHSLFFPQMEGLLASLGQLAGQWNDVPMLARTHGQPASPTRLGKEIAVFAERIKVQLAQLRSIPMSAKFGGATGNFNAHVAAYPQVDWIGFANHFVNETLGLNRSQTTTQVEHYDNLAALFDGLKRINTILIDLCRDMWSYISLDYFKQKLKEGEVGSSAMPHKVNPIDFENAEGNLGVANALFEHLSGKLPISRLQRDLTDSTVLRNVGVPLAHSFLSLLSVQRGLGKLVINMPAINRDLDANWMVIAEGIQTILRREGYGNPYEALKALTRTNKPITQNELSAFIDSLEVSPAAKAELKALSPHNYTGIPPKK